MAKMQIFWAHYQASKVTVLGGKITLRLVINICIMLQAKDESRRWPWIMSFFKTDPNFVFKFTSELLMPSRAHQMQNPFFGGTPCLLCLLPVVTVSITSNFPLSQLKKDWTEFINNKSSSPESQSFVICIWAVSSVSVTSLPSRFKKRGITAPAMILKNNCGCVDCRSSTQYLKILYFKNILR